MLAVFIKMSVNPENYPPNSEKFDFHVGSLKIYV